MSNKFYKTKEFKELNDIWKKKLAKAGFEDIERNEYDLSIYHSFYFADSRRYDEDVAAAKENYYRLAGQFLYEHKFKTKLDRRIWELHSQGLTIRDIEKAVNKRNRRSYKDYIHRTIKALEKEMINKC